jgi:hypothetical protein
VSITANTLSLTPVAHLSAIKPITQYLARKYGTFEREASATSLLGDRRGKALTNCHRNRSFPVNSLYSNQSEVVKSQLSRKRQMSTRTKPKLAAHAYPEQDEDHVFQLVGAHLMGYGWEGGVVETPSLCIDPIGGGTAECSKVRSEFLDINSSPRGRSRTGFVRGSPPEMFPPQAFGFPSDTCGP